MMEDGGEEILKLVSAMVIACITTIVSAYVATTISAQHKLVTTIGN
jgi:hypothetical protein